jgi:hypothetical protein
MRTSKSIQFLLALGLGSLVRTLATEENLHKMVGVIGHTDKRCPYSDMHCQVKAGEHKRFLVDSMSSPIDSISSTYPPYHNDAEGC